MALLTINGEDISGAATAATVFEQANGGAASLELELPASIAGGIQNGAEAILSAGGLTLFCGRVMSRSISREMATLKALDSLTGLKIVLPIQRRGEKADAFIKRLMALAAPWVKAGEIEACPVALPDESYNKTPLTELIYKVIGEVKGGGRFLLRDEGGFVAFRNEQSLICDKKLDGSSLLELEQQLTVGEAYNYIRLTSNSVENAVSATAVAKSDEAIGRWGLRSYVAEVRQRSAGQLMADAMDILKQSSSEKERLTALAQGDASARAGCLVWLEPGDDGGFWARVLQSEHRFEGKSHLMRLELERL